MRSALCALLFLVAACSPALVDLDETTTGIPEVALECLYDGDCGEDARCQAGACVLQCEGVDCCMLVGECDRPQSCGEPSDCPQGYVCDAGTCALKTGVCSPPPELAHG